MRFLAKTLVLLAWIVLIPTAALAQAVIAGTVKDSSGGVLPGVTVEAASPALIESNSNVHNHFPLPIAVVGGANGRVKGNQHLRYPDHTPIANVLKAMLDKTGIPVEKIGDSTAEPVAL